MPKTPIRIDLTALLLLASLALGGCGALLPSAPKCQSGAECRQQALFALNDLDYRRADRALEKALAFSPASDELYLMRGEVQEVLDRPSRARDTYLAGLASPEAAQAAGTELAYRLALVLALKLESPDRAATFLADLPPASADHFDLRGVIRLSQGNPAEALPLFAQALNQEGAEMRRPWIDYHTALAQESLGQGGAAIDSLFHAINLTRNRALARDIEVLFTRLRGDGTHR